MTHKICASCNNGWLSDIDNSCNGLVKELINYGVKANPANINPSEISKLYALIYKMFLNFLATSPFKYDKLPFYRAFYESRIPPADVLLFRCSICTSSPLAIGHLDNWSIYQKKTDVVDWSQGSESGLRFKFFVQFGHASFVMCCAGNQHGQIVYDDFLLQPIVGNANSKVAKCNFEAHPTLFQTAPLIGFYGP